MKFTAVTVAALAAGASAQKVVEYPINKGLPGIRMGKPLPEVVGKMFGKRDTATSVVVNNITGGGYYIDVEVGTPGQKQTMVLDTGSSDAWIVDVDADLCSDRSLQRTYGDSCSLTYDRTQSSTYKMAVRNGFSIQYLDESEASGDYIYDNFKIADVTIKGLQIGLADTVVMGTGVLGIGFPANEAAVEEYPNIIDQLADQGLINSRAYSLYLNDRRSSSGTILFGGIDTDKFIGDLKVLPILKGSGSNYTHFAVRMTSITTDNDGTTTTALQSSSGIAAILDSGTTLSYVPDDISVELVKALNAYTDYVSTGLTFIDCGLLTSDLTITFGFGTGSTTATIVVPVTEMILDMLQGLERYFPDDLPFDDVCLFGIQSADSFGTLATTALLGDTFLRSAYVVYDLDHKEIGMAQSNLNSTETKITELSSAGSVLPAATGAATQQTTASPTQSTSPTGTSSSSRGSGTSAGSDGGKETVTVTATPSGNAAGMRAGAGGDAFSVVVLAGMFSVLGGAFFML
jgi:hypothetical protein